MSPQLQAKLNNIVWRLHERRGRVAESVELRKKYIEATYAAQIDSERKLLQSRIQRLQPSLQRQFLEGQLRKLNGSKKSD
jgi:hypothetical protein